MTGRRPLIPIMACLALMLVPLLSATQPLHLPLDTPAQDKAFSELNHHIAGAFLLAIGVMAFLSALLPRLAILGRVWPLLFIVPGIYLAFMSDPNTWPMGNQGWIAAFRHDPEAAQHKIFAALLLGLGALEFQRSRGKLGAFPATWGFPALALLGAVLLFFHSHADASGGMGPMQGMHHSDVMTESMIKVRREHLWFSIAGFCVVLFKFLSDSGRGEKLFARLLWPLCISILAVLLLLYSE